MSIPRKNTPRKEKSAGDAGTDCHGRQGRPRNDGGGGLTAPLRGAAGFTADELAELARADAEIDDEEIFLTPEERALSRALDRQAAAARRGKKRAGEAAARARETPEHRAHRLEKERIYREAHREALRAKNARYNAAHRQERRDYQKAYDAAHREEINARRREKYAAKRAAVKRKEGNNGREI
jgi:hypothetical protein